MEETLVKRNRATVSHARRKKATGKSRYKTKQEAGNQLYGPGCCAHTVSEQQVRKAKENARYNGTYRESYYVSRRGHEVWREENY